MSALSHKLKLLRRQEALSQKALADLTGIAQGAIGDVESGRKRSLGGESLFKLCNHPRLRKYALWLITDADSLIAEDVPAYSAIELADLLGRLSPEQQREVLAFIRLLQAQEGPA